MADDHETLIFLHVPKAGGNSFLDFLVPNFQDESRFDVSAGLRYVERLEELAALPKEELRKLGFIYGHLPFGVHESLPQMFHYITVLRDPIDRILSHYYFVKEQRKHPLHEAVVSQKMSVADYVQSGLSGELNNGMVRLICGRPESDSLRGHAPCQPDDLQQATENLKTHFSIIGLLEEMHATQQLVARRMGWAEKEPVRRNQTKARKSISSLRKRDREAIISNNDLDLQLYAWARERFRHQCQAEGIVLAADSESSEPSGFAPLRICKRFLFPARR
ncbi:MAG: sulfotransferase family 2 domain-containing protein [Planctomycetota bacterium]